MSRIPPHIIDEIMQTSRIEEVIGDFVVLKRAGSNLKGLSPFTDEKTPSFVVSPAKQIFKCFSTGKGGTVVTFLMEKEHFSYPEALRWLADKYGIQVPEEAPATAEELAAVSERESLHIINEFAKSHFVYNLNDTEEGNAVALSYFQERGFRKDIIEKFQLGYCLNTGDDLTKIAKEKGYKLEYLEKVGLVKSKEDRQFDFFRGRVMFPIHSVTGRVLGFGGRTLFTDKKVAKYFNSPESIIYNKSEILYGLYLSKGDIIKYDNCFLCEGYTDVISMYQAGIQNVVSSSGTSLTKDQIKLIRRYTKNITILYDGDAAGIKASFRGIDLILEEGMNVKVVLFPEGEDPDSFSKKSSTTELEEYIKTHTQDFISFKSDILLKDGESDPIKRADLIRDIVHSVALIPDQITRTVYIQKIAQQFGLSEQLVASELIKQRRTVVSNETNEPLIKEIPLDIPQVKPNQQNNDGAAVETSANEYDLIRIMVKYGTRLIETEQLDDENKKIQVETSVAELIHHELDKDELSFIDPLHAEIYALIVDGLEQKELFSSSYFLKLEDQRIVNFVSDIESKDQELSSQWLSKYNISTRTESDRLSELVLNTIYSFKANKIEEKIHSIRKKLEHASELEEMELMDLLAEQMAYERVKMIFADKLGRIILR
ncbi:MAG: DNA primase [Cryomorphaceae bacterium]|jgi:DNA primase|nr:DNA primase [Cryomorphaceae bacterium]